jgi:hypothetical protein
VGASQAISVSVGRALATIAGENESAEIRTESRWGFGGYFSIETPLVTRATHGPTNCHRPYRLSRRVATPGKKYIGIPRPAEERSHLLQRIVSLQLRSTAAG